MYNSRTVTTLKSIALGLSLSIFLPQIALSAEPPNTIDLDQEFTSTFTPSDYATAVQYSGAPREYVQQVVPSTRQMVANQLTAYEEAQLTPAQLQRLKELELEKQRVAANPYVHTANPIVRSIAPDLSPGVSPPIIRVSKNILTSIVFTDMEGNPWNIEKVMLNRGQFDDKAGVSDDGSPTNILTIEPTTAIQYGNATVILKGKTIPVIFLLTSGQADVDVRLDVRMKGDNPDMPASPTSISSFTSTNDIDNTALGFLDGTIPSEAEMLKVSDSNVRAWLYGGSVYMKTSLDVLYPAYNSRAKSPDSTNIYRFDNTPKSITLMQRGGQPITVTLNEMPYQYDN